MSDIHVLIADDHTLLRQGIRMVLELEPDIKIVGEASDGEEALEQVALLKPDILLLDMNMPKKNGLEVAKTLSSQKITTRVIILTIHDDMNYVVETVKAGAAGYLLKDIDSGMLVSAIRRVHQGEPFMYPSLVQDMFKKKETQVSPKVQRYAFQTQSGKADHLTAREIEVLQLIGQGMSNNQIAQKLFLSEKTVKNHLTNIFRKINVNDRTQAVLYAIKNKIVVV